MRSVPFAVACCFASAAVAVDEPVPVQQEPKHKTVFENDYLRIIDVQIPPGAVTLFHVHVIPSVIVYLTKSTNRSETWRTSEVLNRDTAPGQSRYAAYDAKPLAHRVTNTGSSLFRVFDIELLRRPPADPSLTALGVPALKSHWDEKLVRSSALELAAGAAAEIPATRSAYLVVGVTGKTQVRADQGQPANASLGWAEFRFFPAHTRLQIANTAHERAEVVLLELKN